VIDTHAHLDACASSTDELIERARTAGVDRIVTIGSGISSCREALRLSERHPEVTAALGIHPHQAADATTRDLAELRRLLRHERAVAVGEAGLDYYRDPAPREAQQDVFREQARLAGELHKPLVVHSRAADDDTMAVLAEVAPPVVVLHCFSSPALLPNALELGYYVSFAGNVTYPKAVELRLAAGEARADRLLAETDSPYLAPQAHRGRPNEPSLIVHVLEALAEARGQSPADLERTLDENAERVFGPR
jgi:TatD DNase family protein